MQDDELLERIRQEYGSGRMQSVQVKNYAIEMLQSMLAEYQQNKSNVTQQQVDEFMTVRQLQ